MKDYRDMLSSLKDKVVDAAGKAGETVTNAANKVVSDEMRDKVAGAAHAVGDRAKYASRMTRMTVDCNAELERVKRTYTEIGRLYYENYRDTADAFLADLCQQVTDANARVAELEAQMDELRAAAKEYRPAPDLHTVDAERVLRRHRRDSRSRINADSRHCLYVGLYARSARRIGACDCQNYWIFSHTHSFFA